MEISDQQIINILSDLNSKGYITSKDLLARGGNALIYTATKDGKEYVVRITITNRFEYQNLLDRKKQINSKLYSSDDYCIDSTIACSYDIYLHDQVGDNDNMYIVEIMKRYYGSLFNYMVDVVTEDNKSKYVDKTSFYEKSLDDPGSIVIFYEIVNKLKKTINMLHQNGMAHGDIKPENILIDVDKNNRIRDIAISDFDNVCTLSMDGGNIRSRISHIFPKKSSKSFVNITVNDDPIFEKQNSCTPMAGTTLYSTPEYMVTIKKDVIYDIDIMKRTDMYALSIVILTLWFGFIHFMNSLGIGNYNDPFFELLDIFDVDKKLLPIVLINLQNLMNSTYKVLIGKYRDMKGIIDSVYGILEDQINVFRHVKKFRYVAINKYVKRMMLVDNITNITNKAKMIGGKNYELDNHYLYKYKKYKHKYILAKNQDN